MKIWLIQHRRALAQALKRLFGTPVNTLLGVLVIGITLALPAGAEMLLSSLLSFGRQMAATPQLSVFLALDAGQEDVAEIERRLRAEPALGEVRFVSREETRERFRQGQGLGEVLDALPDNPFPHAFVVTPRETDPQRLEALRTAAAAWPKVEQAQLDSDWARRLDALLRLGRLAVMLLAGLLGVAIAAVSFNTIRLQILTQRAEIEVSRLLGATDGYIHRPFYYFGLLQGALGGGLAWLLVLLALRVLQAPVAELGRLYGLDISLQPLGLEPSLLLIGFAAALGWLGSRLSVGRHLLAGDA